MRRKAEDYKTLVMENLDYLSQYSREIASAGLSGKPEFREIGMSVPVQIAGLLCAWNQLGEDLEN